MPYPDTLMSYGRLFKHRWKKGILRFISRVSDVQDLAHLLPSSIDVLGKWHPQFGNGKRGSPVTVGEMSHKFSFVDWIFGDSQTASETCSCVHVWALLLIDFLNLVSTSPSLQSTWSRRHQPWVWRLAGEATLPRELLPISLAPRRCHFGIGNWGTGTNVCGVRLKPAAMLKDKCHCIAMRTMCCGLRPQAVRKAFDGSLVLVIKWSQHSITLRGRSFFFHFSPGFLLGFLARSRLGLGFLIALCLPNGCFPLDIHWVRGQVFQGSIECRRVLRESTAIES